MNRALAAKLMGAFLLVQRGYSRLEKEGSVVFTAGINAFVPPGKSSAVSAANGGLIAYARALAVELSPLRVNVVSPGWTDTPIWSAIATGVEKDRMFASHAEKLPVRRIGEPEDIAEAIMMLLQNKFMTGSVVHVDGGRRLI
jgi:NAD(P)-dependent dehydrogenase (short-subunit alcohol dehydrogenase family)